MMQRAYARLYQAALAADKQRRSRSAEHDVRAKQTKVYDVERTGFSAPAYASNVSCDSKDGVRAGIEAKRNLVTSR